MTKRDFVSLKTLAEIEKFDSLLRRCGNIYLADINRMDIAYNKIKQGVETRYYKEISKI